MFNRFACVVVILFFAGTTCTALAQAAPGPKREEAELRVKKIVSRLEHDGDLNAALTALAAVCSLDPSYPLPFTLMGEITVKQKNWQGALDYYAMAHDADPSDPKTLLYLADLSFKLEKWSTAVEYYKEVQGKLDKTGNAYKGVESSLKEAKQKLEQQERAQAGAEYAENERRIKATPAPTAEQVAAAGDEYEAAEGVRQLWFADEDIARELHRKKPNEARLAKYRKSREDQYKRFSPAMIADLARRETEMAALLKTEAELAANPKVPKSYIQGVVARRIGKQNLIDNLRRLLASSPPKEQPKRE